MATELMTRDVLSPFAPFVRQLIAEGKFATEEEVLAEGLRLLRSRQEFRAEIQKGIDELDQGLGIPAEEVYAELDKLIDEIESGAKK